MAKARLPVINFGDATGAGLQLSNQEWWQILNLEITSGAPPEPGQGRAGIAVLAEGPGSHTGHIVISNCYLHDIWGQLGGTGAFTGYSSAGIFVGPLMGRGRTNAVAASADDVLVESNRIERIDRCGIIVVRAHTNIVVRGNVMEDLGGDGIMMGDCLGGLMEYNIAKRTCMSTGDTNAVLAGGRYNPHSAAMWIINCSDTVMQFNEVYNTGRQQGNGDGEAYDFDFYCTNCIAQFNYSRNNHGLLLIMDKAVRNIAHYNISENDQSHLIEMHGTIAEGNLVNNNVFYVDYGMANITFYMGMTNLDDTDKSLMGANFRNNVFYATGQGRFRTVFTYGPALERQYLDAVKLPPPVPGTLFEHNWYFGPWLNGLPDDPEKKVGNPMFLFTKTEVERIERELDVAAKLLEPSFDKARAALISSGVDTGRIHQKIISGASNAAQAIIDEAEKEGYDTIVVGRRGLSKVEQLIMGRVSNRVIHMAKDRTVWVVS